MQRKISRIDNNLATVWMISCKLSMSLIDSSSVILRPAKCSVVLYPKLNTKSGNWIFTWIALSGTLQSGKWSRSAAGTFT